MIGEGVKAVYIGCATDSKFVELTCTMLSSLDDNGRIPEAVILVADFGLSRSDRAQIVICAGEGREVRFIPLSAESPEIVALPSFDFPLPLLGRFVLPNHVPETGARLLVLDSDMIVNRSLRPLLETNMRGYAIGAVHDAISWREHYGRPPARHYFNAGMMMIDVDRFKAEEIGPRAMRRLAAYDHRPMWLDQDAINDVLGNEWLGLDRRWNFFHANDYRHFSTEDYAAADVIHFSGPKPTEDPNHPAGSIFRMHVEHVNRKLRKRSGQGGNRVFMAMCYEVLLGRQRENEAVLHDRAHLSPEQFVTSIIESAEFRMAVIEPLAKGLGLPKNRFPGKPSAAQRYWAADRLPMLAPTADRIMAAETWEMLVSALVEDRYFMRLAQLDVIRVPEPQPVPVP